MFSEKAKEEREIHHRKVVLERLMKTGDAKVRQAAFAEYDALCTRQTELNATPDTHTCLCCGGQFSAASAHLKFPIPTLIACDETGRPILQTDYGTRHMGAACGNCALHVTMYLDAQE